MSAGQFARAGGPKFWGAGIAVAGLIANTRVILQDAPALGLVFRVAGRHHSTS